MVKTIWWIYLTCVYCCLFLCRICDNIVQEKLSNGSESPADDSDVNRDYVFSQLLPLYSEDEYQVRKLECCIFKNLLNAVFNRFLFPEGR